MACMQDLEERVANTGQSSSARAQADALARENESLKVFVRCPVCNTRPRACVITKCWHMFCKQCVKQRLGDRSRRCPSCGVGFSQSDQHEVFL
jgi:E3 ubiquitin-protein ligase BRE1